jgi:transcriptional/translational regulatory protein YebC/TACO1
MEVALDQDAAGKMFRLVDILEDLDDVQNIYANFDVPDDVMAELEDA